MTEDKFLLDKTVLFIGQQFYNYHEKIIAQLEQFGAKVFFYENKIFREDPVLNNNDLISKVKRIFNPRYKQKYIDLIINETIDENIDILFCIGGFSVNLDLLNGIKSRNPHVKTIIYFWDSFAIWPFHNLVNAFDQVFSFERLDCEKYNLRYLPLFYSDDQPGYIKNNERDIDILYVGSVGIISRNRFEVLASLRNFSEKYGLKDLLYLLYVKPRHNFIVNGINVVRSLFDRKYRTFKKDLVNYQQKYDFIYHKPLDTVELGNLFIRSKTVIDIPVQGQTGLTMRTIESLAMGCKLITSNSSIKKEAFFNDEWIQVLDEENLEIDLEFLANKPSVGIDISHLTLKNWLKSIITS
ncbi:hypothetical protein HDC92_003324 [Pedobacter sp. AK017]|uniref:hypothetical protein n=1 Tax=Pedobacter sp. AK017 TaxID=2723073 RepID=UPI0016087CD6|nr:hypothetical protein [Pedobacter sp. AK017]MBB5439628.1 hypothetical protein [Pedobacter sp. AK017]